MSDYKITKADTSVSPDGTYELVCRLSERLISRLVRPPAGWFFMREKTEYPKQTLNYGMMAGTYAAVYGRLHGMRILWKLFVWR